jgi:hypothetical protein
MRISHRPFPCSDGVTMSELDTDLLLTLATIPDTEVGVDLLPVVTDARKALAAIVAVQRSGAERLLANDREAWRLQEIEDRAAKGAEKNP